jgi:hypothetical protein
MHLRWQSSLSLSVLHAADAMFHQRRLADSALEAALAPAVSTLTTTIAEERLPAEIFLGHLLPLSVTFPHPQQLAEAALNKTVGRTEARIRVPRVRRVLAELKDAFCSVVPEATESLAARVEPLHRDWTVHGTALLHRVAELTSPEILVDEASVVVIHPVLGGGGAASLVYNLVRIEAPEEDPVPELPEVLRLGWLLSMLNLDLPRYSEQVRRHSLARVAALAMLPVTLSAAEVLKLARCDPSTIGLAVRSWVTPAAEADAWTAAVVPWWDVYQTKRPAWDTALQALDQLLPEPG